MIDIKIGEKKNCMGCYACVNICPVSCISMNNDNEGFWYPEVDYDKCIECGKCIDVCPIINKTTVNNNPVAYACINDDESIRMKSSSGGMFTLIAEQIIDDGGGVFGVKFDEEFNAMHDYAEEKEDLEQFRGSKYVQSKIGNTYKQAKKFLDQGKKVLFTGTPCQIGGLKSYLRKDYYNLLCIDIICHGVPSPKVWKKYISHQESIHSKSTKKVSFRRKDAGWKGSSISLLFENDIEYLQNHKKDIYMKAFLKNISLRPSCYECNFKTLHRESDITLADFWGVEHMVPEMDDNKGTSLIFVNSKAGESLLERIENRIIYKEVPINQSVKYNSAAIRSVKYNSKRNIFFNKLDKEEFESLVRSCCSDTMLVRIKRRIKRLLV